MTEIKLKAYYQYDESCTADPLRSRLSDDDAIRNLKLLESDFTHALESATIMVMHEDYDRKEIELLIKAVCPREELMSVVKDVLSKADLYGKIL